MQPELSLPNVSSVSLSAEEKAMAACCGGNIPALQALIQAGVSVNHTSGNTSSNLLHMAAYCGQVRRFGCIYSNSVYWCSRKRAHDIISVSMVIYYYIIPYKSGSFHVKSNFHSCHPLFFNNTMSKICRVSNFSCREFLSTMITLRYSGTTSLSLSI